MEIFVAITDFLLGICCGSFINMLIYRTEIKYKLRKPKVKNENESRSFCDFCGRQLGVIENIPILSWLWLGGKSKCCRKKLPIQYPLVEMTTGILFVMLGNNYLGMVMVTLLIFAAVFDLKHMILPDFSTFILIIIGGIIFHNWWAGLGSVLFLLALHLITKGKGMGMGDVKYAAYMGLLLGWPKIVLAYYMAFFGGAIIGVLLMVFKRYKRNSQMPFGPFLIMATILTYLYGDKLLYYIYRWF